MPFVLRLIPAAAAACLLMSCGGGASAPEPLPPAVASGGVAVDGYLVGATVLCDSNGNGQSDAGERSVGTDASGNFSFPTGCSSGIVVRGGSSLDTGLPFNGVLRSPASATVASPLTSLLASGLGAAQLAAALGLPAGTDVLTTDPARVTGGVLVNADLLKKTLALQQLLQKTTELFAGLGAASGSAVQQAIYTEVVAAFAQGLAGGAVLNSGSTVDAAVLATLVQAAATRVAASGAGGSAVQAALQALNAASLAQVSAAALALQAGEYLASADADITATTLEQQGDGSITTFIVANAGQLGGAPSEATAALAAQLAAEVGGGPVQPPTDFLALATDSLSLVNGNSQTGYTMAQFESAAGVALSWPVAKTMTVRVSLAEVGTYVLPAGQKLTAALAITELPGGGQGELQAYVADVNVRKTAGGLEITVPAVADARVYGVSADGAKRAVIDFAASVAGVGNTLATAAGSSNSIVFGEVVDYAVNKIGSDFSGIAGLRGKYKVSVVINGLPIRRADGSALPVVAITVPTVLGANGQVTASKSIAGPGLVGFITLTD